MDLRDIFAKDKLLDFWPTSRQTAEERVLATTRFILYAIVLVYLIRRDARVVALGVLVLAALYGLYTMNMIPDGVRVPIASPKVVNGVRQVDPATGRTIYERVSYYRSVPVSPALKGAVGVWQSNFATSSLSIRFSSCGVSGS